MRTQTILRMTACTLVLIALVACAAEPTPTATVVPTATPPPPTPTEAPPTPTEVPPTPTEAPPTATPTEAPPTMTPTPTEPAPTPTPDLSDEELISMGQEVYTLRCQTCHQEQGQGVPGAYPPLAGSALVTAEDPAAAIERVLLGRGAMPGFQFFLSDQEIAAVISFIRNTWGNDASMVTIEEVEQVKSEIGSE